MDAHVVPFLSFLQGSDTSFLIPIYQRSYNWKAENECKQLFDDIVDVAQKGFREHFCGSIVSINFNKRKKDYLIIDGQQRITTLILLLLAIVHYVEKNKIESNVVIPQQIKSEYLINPYAQEGENKVKLRPVNQDDEALKKLFDEDEERFIKNSNVTLNYQYFLQRIENSEISVEDLFTAIKGLMVVDIFLHSGSDNPQAIFESLNSTGLKLSQSDLVRNFILMNEEDQTQQKYFKDYWSKIEENTLKETDSFIRDYLTYATKNTPNLEKVYAAFKLHVFDLAYNASFIKEDFLKKITKFSRYYKQIINHSYNDNQEINRLLKIITDLKVTVSYPFFMEVFSDVDEGIISVTDLKNILELVINYMFRRSICDARSNALNKVFPSLVRSVKKHSSYDKNYFEILKSILLSKTGGQRFPNDEEFREKLRYKEIYKMSKEYLNYYFSKMENSYHSKETLNIENLTKEHIMPQTLTNEWIAELGPEYETIYTKYLHTIGNLTITGYNFEYSNLPFIKKKTMENGFDHSPLRLNDYMRRPDVTSWGRQQIEERADILIEKAIEVWKYPDISYNLTNETAAQNEYSIFDEDIDITGEKIYRADINNRTIEVNTWYGLTVKVIEELNNLEPILLLNFAENKNSNKFNKNCATADFTMRLPEQVLGMYYLETNVPAMTNIELIRELIDFCKAEIDVTIYTNNTNKKLAASI